MNDVVSEKIGGSTYQESGESTTSSTVEETEEYKNMEKDVIEMLENVLYLKNTSPQYPQYEDLSSNGGDINIQKQWVRVIYNYRIVKNVKYEKIADNNGINKKSDLYNKLKNDISAAMKSKQKSKRSQ